MKLVIGIEISTKTKQKIRCPRPCTGACLQYRQNT